MALSPRSFSFAIAFLVFVPRPSCAAEEATCVDGRGISACSSAAHGSDGLTPASLLQRVFRRLEKHKLVLEEAEAVTEQPKVDSCAGVLAQGRCWFLSNVSESCGDTCARHGGKFSYMAADSNERVTEKLLGHKPIKQQDPWVAFECYEASEDRYHVANANAAKLHEGIADWSHPDCRLACPCVNMSSSGSTTTAAPTYAPTQSPTAAPTAAPTDVPTDAPTDSRKDGKCSWRPVASCVPEFDYEGTHYVGCTSVDHFVPWCSNANPFNASWSQCVYSCGPEPARNRSADSGTRCAWKPRPKCARSFVYKGVNHTGCIDIDYPTPWCSYDSVHKGFWASCEWNCTRPEVQPTERPVQPIQRPPTESNKTGAPCDRDAPLDNIAAEVQLDAAGYKIVVATDSPSNMKCFVCRLLERIRCKVTDRTSLMDFVNYYLGPMGHEASMILSATFDHLENELQTICKAGGRWLVPIDEP